VYTWIVKNSFSYRIVIIQNGMVRHIILRTAVVVIGLLTANISGRQELCLFGTALVTKLLLYRTVGLDISSSELLWWLSVC